MLLIIQIFIIQLSVISPSPINQQPDGFKWTIERINTGISVGISLAASVCVQLSKTHKHALLEEICKAQTHSHVQKKDPVS